MTDFDDEIPTHEKGWRSTSDEVWNRPAICLTCEDAWPCDAAVLQAHNLRLRSEVQVLRANLSADLLVRLADENGWSQEADASDGFGPSAVEAVPPSPEVRVKACPECGSPDVISLVSTDVECLTCGMTSMGYLRSKPEVAAQRKAVYLAAQAALDSPAAVTITISHPWPPPFKKDSRP